MHYLIDGYNLLFRLPKTKGSLENKRLLLIEELNDAISKLHLQATVVFDASDERSFSTRSHYDAIEIVYTTKKISADAYILNHVEESRKPGGLCVVSSDSELIRKSKALGSKTMQLKEFLAMIQKKQVKLKRKSRPAAFFECKDSSKEIARLLMIFEKKLLEDLTKDS
jgi:uncharacterized protein